MIKFFFLCLLISQHFLVTAQSSQEVGKLKHYIHAGFNIGAMAPVSLPNTIRKIESYAPAFCPSIGYEAVYSINEKWGISAGVKLEYKGMTVKDSVQYFHTIISVSQNGQTNEFEGDFTGTNKTNAQNAYITIPLTAEFSPGVKWRYKLGVYFAWLIKSGFSGDVSDGYIRNGNSLGEKILITTATFDFSEIERTFDWGIVGGAERSLGKKFAINGTMNWGLQPVFPSSFKGIGFNMYNIFFTLGASYRLR